MKLNETLEANRAVHSALAESGEYNKSPHFRPENQEKVKAFLLEVLAQVPNSAAATVLDMGCGTGFILHMLAPSVRKIVGIDITDEMMAQVDLSFGNIELKKATAESTGLEDGRFDLVTAYSFLDHLADYEKALSEAYRVLKPGGFFYADLNPNRAFASLMEEVERSGIDTESLPHSISREILGALHNGEHYAEKYGIDEDTLLKAEPQKTLKRGFDLLEVKVVASRIGFSQIDIVPHWFLGEGVMMNSGTSLKLEDINEYLLKMQPASLHFFKYLRFLFRK